MHKFTYEIEYKRDYEVFHKTYTDCVTARNWHEACGMIQHLFQDWPTGQMGNDHVLAVRLIKED